MGALVNGHLEYRDDGEWHHDHVIWDVLIGGRDTLICSGPRTTTPIFHATRNWHRAGATRQR
jgi:hypothetical protein